MLSAVAFSITPILVNIVYAMGLNTTMVSFFRTFLVLPVLFISLRSRRISLRVPKNTLKKLGILTIFGQALTMYVLYASYNYIDVGLATTLHYIYPIIVTVIGICFFKERYNYLKILALFVSILGIVLILNRQSASSNQLAGVLLAILSGISYAFFIIYMDVTELKYNDSILVTFYVSLISSVLFFLIAVAKSEFSLHYSWIAYLLLICISIVTAIMGMSFLQLGIQHIGASTASILSTLEPILSVVLGVLIFRDVLSFRKIIACGLIFSSVIFISLGTKMEERKEDGIGTN